MLVFILQKIKLVEKTFKETNMKLKDYLNASLNQNMEQTQEQQQLKEEELMSKIKDIDLNSEEQDTTINDDEEEEEDDQIEEEEVIFLNKNQIKEDLFVHEESNGLDELEKITHFIIDEIIIKIEKINESIEKHKKFIPLQNIEIVSNNIVEDFDFINFTKDKEPPLICTLCNKEGHLCRGMCL